MKICVFCSAADVDPKYVEAARELGELIGRGSHTLVWGGSDRGLMHVVAESAQRAGGSLVGVTMELLHEHAYAGASEMLIEKNLADRKAAMLQRSDAFVILPGGVGTLDEFFEIAALKTHGLHDKPIAVLDTENFYAGLRAQLQKMSDEGFLHRPLPELVHFAISAESAMDHIESYGN